METNRTLSGNILRILSGLPDHLRKSMIQSKIGEFSAFDDEQKTETINSMLEGYRDLDKENLKPVLLTSFRVILSQDPHMIVNTFCIYFDILVLHPEFVQSLDLQPLIETLDIISLDQKRLLFDCYFEALFLHPKRDTLKSMMPEFAAQFLRA